MLLAEKPSVALRQALKDLETAEKDPRVVIDMGDWIYVKENKCEVCLAGAMMIAGQDIDKIIADDGIDMVLTLTHKHKAIDQFRVGRLWDAVWYWKNPTGTPWGFAGRVEGLPEYFPAHDYNDDPDEFKEDMHGIIAMLEGVGL